MGKKYTDKAIGFNVIVEYEMLPRTVQLTEGGAEFEIYASDEDWMGDQATHTIGTIIDIGPTAFHHPRYGYEGQVDWLQPFKAGDKVRFKAHAGHQYREGRDSLGDRQGAWLTCCQDNDILTTVKQETCEWPNEKEKREKVEAAEKARAEREDSRIATPDKPQIIVA